jgi:creatinine amidohydrolase
MLHYHPELVHKDRLEGELLDGPYEDGLKDMFASALLTAYRGFEEYSTTGAIGDPTLATAEKGELLANRLGEKLAMMLHSIHERNRS